VYEGVMMGLCVDSVGFAARNTVSDILSGAILILTADYPFKRSDLFAADSESATVENIGLHPTRMAC